MHHIWSATVPQSCKKLLMIKRCSKNEAGLNLLSLFIMGMLGKDILAAKWCWT